ncbi:hypothetical protein [Barnesiella sp.]|nr:hypothetical protein [Barnesiella sp.]
MSFSSAIGLLCIRRDLTQDRLATMFGNIRFACEKLNGIGIRGSV